MATRRQPSAQVTVEFSSSSSSAVLSEEPAASTAPGTRSAAFGKDDQLAITLDDLAYRSLLLGFGFLCRSEISREARLHANHACIRGLSELCLGPSGQTKPGATTGAGIQRTPHPQASKSGLRTAEVRSLEPHNPPAPQSNKGRNQA